MTSYTHLRRRLRTSPQMRELSAAVSFSHKDFIQPLFIDETIHEREAMPSLTGVNRDTIDSACRQIEQDLKNGVTKFLLFPVPQNKSDDPSDFSFFVKALRTLRTRFGHSIWMAADVCLCAYTLHGHCGIMHANGGHVLNAETNERLAAYTLQLSQAGADCIAPSDVMDGRVKAIRLILDENQFHTVSIMSYGAKFQSSFYGPFRQAGRCSLEQHHGQLLDRKTYQISLFNPADAVASAKRDVDEGADLIIVKPASLYQDIIYRLHREIHQPLVAYHVSGEYQGVELLAREGLLARDKGHIEVWTGLFRSGVHAVISYASREAKNWIDKIEY